MKDMITFLKSELYDFSYLQQNAFDKEDAYSPINRQIALLEIIRKIFDIEFHFTNHDDARAYFLLLQNKIKNMNFTSFESPRYLEIYAEIKDMLNPHTQKVL